MASKERDLSEKREDEASKVELSSKQTIRPINYDIEEGGVEQWVRPNYLPQTPQAQTAHYQVQGGLQTPPQFNQNIFSVNFELSPKPKMADKIPTSDEMVVATTYARGYLLNGIDVSTGDIAKEHPSSLLIRLTDQGSLPNGLVGDFKDCRLVAHAFGHRSNERAEVKVSKLVCTQQDKKVIATDVLGYVVDAEDGKQGLAGKVIRRGGELLWQGIIGQGLASMAKAVSGAAGTSSISPQGLIKSFSTQEAIKSSAYAGAGGALDRLAEQAIKELNEIKPIIQIKAKKAVDVVFLENSEYGFKRPPTPAKTHHLVQEVIDQQPA